MKMFKKILTLSLTVMLLFSLTANKAMATGVDGTVSSGDAVGKKPYTYTVTFYAGNQGVFDGTEGLSVSNQNAVITQSDKEIVVSGLNLGDEVGLTAQSAISFEDTSKYYVQGIRLSGRDNDTVAASAFTVEEDADYVVAYGIKGNQVSYTVKYQDANGNQMAADETFYGNVGDKPVIAYKYIAGYAPQYLGVTKTLSANAAENVFTFVYEPVPTNTINEVVTENVVERVETIVVPGGNGGTGGAGNAGAGGNEEDTEVEDGTGGETTDGEGTGDNTETDETDETTEEDSKEDDDEKTILDLDDEEVPLDKPDVDADGTVKALQFAGYVCLAVAAVLGLGVIFFVAKKRTKGEETPENPEE